MPKLKIKLPKELVDLPETHRQEILGILAQALKLPKTISYRTMGGDEHNMWSRNGDQFLANAEDELYETLVEPWKATLARLFIALDLPTDDLRLEKAYTDEFMLYAQLLKSKDGGKSDILELIKTSKRKRDTFVKYIQDGNAWTKEQLKKIDNLLKSNLPSYARIAEEFMVRAGFLGKVRNTADRELLETTGALIDRFPQTIRTAEQEGIVLTLREKEKAEAKGRQVEILPLTKQELNIVQHAEQHAADKLTEINDRHRAAVRQMVIRAKQERWSAQQLAQKLFDAFGEQNRDWRRVAITELSTATNNAYLAGCEEGDEVIGMGADNACKHCKAQVIGKVFRVSHKIHTDADYSDHATEKNYVWVGKSNYGRSTAASIPCVPMHPNCRCRWHRLSRFYKLGKNGTLELKSTAELIQEERARRGLPPDPNLPSS